MRNLKKILALVLALVMSLSLMATAGASSFPDVDAENPYATAIDVLDELKVFQGYKEDGTFRPTETLNRAQAAVLVYRIATGDVEDKYLDNYTYMQQSKFTDLDGYNWAKGYINYCQNAGIVVGTTATTFDPGAKVTGYQLLVMLLRTLGYGKAGEFSDPKGWELQTATIAEREGITKNVTAGDFGAPAARQMVAEILFRGLLTDTVEYSALIPGGYTKSGETLGKREFGLEQVSGVVMANQWANLEGDSVAKADTTVMKIDDKNVTVNKATDLDAVGLTYNAYIANGEGSTKRALTLEKSDVNVVAFNEGAGMDVSKLAKDNSLNVNDAEYYLNYAEKWSETAKSDWRIAYTIKKDIVDASAHSDWKAYIEEINGSSNNTKDGHTATLRTIKEYASAPTGVPYWYVVIRPGSTITAIDLDIMEYIFAEADRTGENTENTGDSTVRNYNDGEVYAGTSSTLDRSDVMSWPEFVEEFLDGQNTNEYDKVRNGNSLRIVDNNGDGKAEYVLKVTYTQDKAIGERRDVLQFNKLVISKYEDNNLAMMDEIAVGDVINYTIIDGKLTVYKADMITDTIRNKNFKDTTVIATEEGETHGQSEIDVYTNMETNIMLMAEKTSYNIYFDEFGYIRSYELAQGTQYALLTEMYTTGTQNWNYINKNNWIAEVKIADGDIEEMNVANTKNNSFISETPWTHGGHNSFYNGNLNFLQPAIAHLGGEQNSSLDSKNSRWYWPGETDGVPAAYPNWDRSVYPMKAATGVQQPAYGVFNYGPVTTTLKNSFSFTNVASFTTDGEDITLAPATRLAKETATGKPIYRVGSAASTAAADNVRLPLGKAATEDELVKLYDEGHGGTGGQAWFNAQVVATHGTGIYPVYAIDYVQLTAENVKAGMRHFTIDNKGTTDNYGYNYNTTSNTYVNANSETVFYVVEPNRVTYYDSYEKLPTIKAEAVRAAYAVATNTNANADGMDYWVGDVIVIETDRIDKSWDSIALAYANPYENSGAVRYLNTLNSEWRTYQPDSDELAKIGLVPSDSDWNWGNEANPGHAFYEVYGTDYENGELAAAIAKITQDWNDHGIYAGTVRRTRSLTMGNGYIDVDTLGRSNLVYDDSFVKPIDVDYDYDVPFYRLSGDWDASEIEFATEWTNPSGVQVGDEIIWVTDKDGDVAFVVDLGYRTGAQMDGDAYRAPTWLLSGYDAFSPSDDGSAGCVSGTGWYYEILKEQRRAVPTMADVNISANVGAGTTLTVSLDGAKLGEAKNNTALPGTVTVPVSINSTSSAVDLKVTASKAGGGNEALTFVLGSVSGNWSLLSYTGDANNVYTLRLVNSQITAARAISGDIVLFTEEFFEELDELAEAIENNGIGNDAAAGEVTLADAKVVKALLNDVSDILGDTGAYTAKSTEGDAAATAAVTAKKSEVDTAKTAVDDAVAEADPATEVSSVAITWDTTTAVAVGGTLPVATTATEGVTLTTVWKNSSNETVTTAAAAGNYTGTVTVTAEEGYELAESLEYTGDVTDAAGLTKTITVVDGSGDPIEVSSVAITWDTTTAVAVGGTLPVATTNTSGVTLTTVWKNSSDETVTTAAAAGDYTGTVTVTAKTGYKLADTLQYTGDVTAASGLTKTITVSAGTSTPTEVSSVAITWDTTTAVAVGGTLPEASTNTEGVTLTTVWKNSSDETVTTAAAAGDYTGTVTVTAETGYKLADTLQYTGDVTAASGLTKTISVSDGTQS